MADEERPYYSIDTSSLIRWYEEDYSPDVFEGLPDRLSELIADGRLRVVRYIRDVEIKDSQMEEENLAKWCKAQADLYVDDDEQIQLKVKELMAQFQNPKKRRGIEGADPFVISYAAINGPNWYVVSEEALHNASAEHNPTIPFVCHGIGVKHISFLELLRMENWKLR